MRKLQKIVLETVLAGAVALASGTALAAKGGEKSGGVELTNAQVTPFTVVNVGGGTWNYGSEIIGAQKHGWSYYYHPDLYHSATAIVGKDTKKTYASAGSWAYADAYDSWYYTAYAYWNTY